MIIISIPFFYLGDEIVIFKQLNKVFENVCPAVLTSYYPVIRSSDSMI